MTKQSQTLLLADNFPAKAYLLVTHLTDATPSVASFCADGTAFEIYDQNVFAQRYLPQFFKHANYGSFVRQLNLYGFTSSRLKGNTDVVVWHHACFQRDHQDLLKDMKRTKKTKSAKPAHGLPPAAVRIRSPSSSDEVSVPSHASKPTDVDRDWLEAEFSKIADQNKFLETKLAEQNTLLETRLEMLLQLTLRIAPASSFADVKLGGKRCRMSPMESDPAARHQSGFVYEEQKVCDDDHCGSEHAGENYEIEPAPYRGRGDSSQLNRSIAAAVGTPEPRTSDCSLTKFIDIMLNEKELEECRSEEVHDHDNTSIKSHAVSPDNEPIRPNDNSASLQDCASCDSILGDELMEEAFEALVPETAIDVSGDLFAVDDEVGEPAAPPPSNEYPFELVTMANYALDKTEGPEPVPSSVPDVPHLGSRDLEAGHLPVGVTIVAAHAELVEDGDAEGERHAERPREWRDRRKVVYLLAFIGVVLSIGVTVTTVFVSRKKKAPARLGNTGNKEKPCKKTGSCKAGKEVEPAAGDDARQAELEVHNDTLVSSVEAWRSYRATTSSKAHKSKATKSKKKTTKKAPEEWSKRSETLEHGQSSRASLFDAAPEDRFSSFNLTLGGTDFVCNLNS